jgi:diheme cytochrome c
VWARPAVKSPANCSACHPGADSGHYDDDTVTVPR